MRGERGCGLRLLVAGCVMAMSLAVSVSVADASSTLDFGDAPDGRPAGYAGLSSVVGRFPSILGSNGARHSSTLMHLGPKADRESDSRQVDLDTFDDGFGASLRRCATSTISFVVNASSLPTSMRTAEHTIYLNAWFDWTRDGDWGDADACAGEWLVQNRPYSLASFGTRPVQVLTITVRAGGQVNDLWARGSLTVDEPFVSPVGAGSFVEGETEDIRIASKGGPGINARCRPNPAIFMHGANAKVMIVGTNIALLQKKIHPDSIIPKGMKVALGPNFFTVTSKKDPPKRLQGALVVIRLKSAAGAVKKIRCYVTIVHDKPVHVPPPPLDDRSLVERTNCVFGGITMTTPTHVRMRVTGQGLDRPVDELVFDTEMLSMDLAGGGITVAPVTPGGATTWVGELSAPRGGRPDIRIVPSAPYAISSFFDVFVEFDVAMPPPAGMLPGGFTGSGGSLNGSFTIQGPSTGGGDIIA